MRLQVFFSPSGNYLRGKNTWRSSLRDGLENRRGR